MEAPLGYQLSNEVKKVVLNENTKGVGDVYSFVYLNTLLPVTTQQKTKTDDIMNIALPMAIMCIAGAGMVVLRRKKED